MEIALSILAVFLLVFANGFFVAGEFALVGARRTRITQMAQDGHRGARAAEKAIGMLDSYIAATQLGITLASLALGWIGEPALGPIFESILHYILPEHLMEEASHSISVALSFTLVTMLHIVLGELAPKSIALQRPEGTSVIIARPTALFLKLFRPVIFIMNTAGNAVVRLMGFHPAGEHAHVHSAEELEMLIHSSHNAGLLEESEELMLRRVFDFKETRAHQIMTPRVDLVAFDCSTPLEEIQAQTRQNHFSRYPIYNENMDNIIGIVHVKDLYNALATGKAETTDQKAVDLPGLCRQPLYVPGTLPTFHLLERMRRTQNHLAVVIDEYGGVAGIVTLEDVLEELVGEIADEFDDAEDQSRAASEKNNVDGLTTISDLAEQFGPLTGPIVSTTAGGYISEKLGRIPRAGDSVPYNDYDLLVQEMDGMRVASILVKRRVEV